jgi:hypothetical protein
MTAAQKTAKAKFKQAIAYRTKTGVSLKEAFAHVYGKKVGAAPKKKATKKAAPKKAAKKVVKKAAPKKAAKKKHTKYGVVKKHVRRVAGVVKHKKIKEQSILNKIHKVKDQVNQLDELQHKHMIGSIDKYKNTMKEVKLYDAALRKVSDNFKGLSAGEKARVKRVKKKLIDARNELKTHAAQLKKTF